jgi:hypothetical protein
MTEKQSWSTNSLVYSKYQGQRSARYSRVTNRHVFLETLPLGVMDRDLTSVP